MNTKTSLTFNSRMRTLETALTITPADGRALLTRFDEQFRGDESALFASEGASGGERWAPLSPAYAAAKAGARTGALASRRKAKAAGLRTVGRASVGRTILIRKGDLRASFASAGGDHVARFSPFGARMSFVMGSRDPIARYHAHGTARMPRRDPRQRTHAQTRAYKEIIRTFVIARLRSITRGLSG